MVLWLQRLQRHLQIAICCCVMVVRKTRTRENKAAGEVRKVKLICAKKMYKREGDCCTKVECLPEQICSVSKGRQLMQEHVVLGKRLVKSKKACYDYKSLQKSAESKESAESGKKWQWEEALTGWLNISELKISMSLWLWMFWKVNY